MASKEVIWWPALCGNDTLDNAFWDPARTLFTYKPDLTRCMQNTLLVWIPSAILMLWSPWYFRWMKARCTPYNRGHSWLNTFKVGCSVFLALVASVQFFFSVYQALHVGSPTPEVADYITPLVHEVTYVLCAAMQYMEYRARMRTSGTMFLFWTVQFLTSVTSVRSLAVGALMTVNMLETVNLSLSFAFITLSWILTFFLESDNVHSGGNFKDLSFPPKEKTPLLLAQILPPMKPAEVVESDAEPSPELETTYVGNIMYSWFSKMIYQGWKRSLTFDDLYDLLDREKCKVILPGFLRAWFKQISDFKEKNSAKISLLRAIVKSMGWTLLLSWVARTGQMIVTLINPLILGCMLTYIDSGDPYTWKGYALALLLLINIFVGQLMQERFNYHTFNFGIWSRTALTSAVYRKAMKLSSAARRQTAVGEIVNIISVDVQKLQDLPPFLASIWVTPITAIVATGLMWQYVGPAALVGILVLVALVPFNGIYVGTRIRKCQAKQMKVKDERAKIMSEILSGMKVLKLYAWEPSFKERVEACREKELEALKWTNILNGLSTVLWATSPYLVSLVIFAVYTLSDPSHVMTADKVFVCMSLCMSLSNPLSFLPNAVNFTGQSLVALQRIQKFLLLDELDESSFADDAGRNGEVRIRNGTFGWDKEETPALRNINTMVDRGELVAVVGPVGSGKSSLMACLLGEMFRHSGNVSINGSTAYVPQQPWIRNATVRDNILFGKPYDARKYKSVLDACALGPDLDILTFGDMTEIGEKGINLSGGQKARVSLARAVYQDEDIYLLDDPLSAVDAHVSSHIFTQVLGPQGLLAGKTRILVTHSVRYLPFMDHILVMSCGMIAEAGTYEELLNQNGDFADFLRSFSLDNYSSNNKNEDSNDRNEEKSMENQVDKSNAEGDEGIYAGSEKSSDDSDDFKGRRSRRESCLSDSLSFELSSDRELEKETIDQKPKLEKGQLIQAESAATGDVSWAVLRAFLVACGPLTVAIVAVLHSLYIGTMVASNLWLSYWSTQPVINGTQPGNGENLGIYTAIVLTHIGLVLVGAVFLAMCFVGASRTFHHNMLGSLLRAPMAFYDTTPLGRIMNRISKDMDYLDFAMPHVVRLWVFTFLPLVATAVITCYTTPIFAVVIVPVAVIYVASQRVYIRTARQLRRVDAVKRSPLFIHFDESYVGATSIRAYRREQEFIERCDKLIDDSQRAWYLVLMSQRWMGTRLGVLGSVVTFLAAFFAIMEKDNIGSGMAGMSINFSLQLCLYLNVFVRASADLETYLVAVERIREYALIEEEAPWTIPSTAPAESWPAEGEVCYNRYSTRYRPGLELVLKDLTFTISPGQKVGVVGRTGAGKSSMALSLFRIIEASAGSITIDGVDVSKLGLHELRSRLTIIPQDPVLFSGTLRSNLDPFEKHSDKELWEILEMAHLLNFMQGLEDGLDHQVGENGEALSVGQRQLVCLARALLRRSRVLVLDEATAGVDLETDALIQTTIRSAFAGSTLITVAHRINTIMDYDKVLVMNAGRIQEFDSPSNLLKDPSSTFFSMAREAGLTQ